MTISILGCGWLGLPLGRHLKANGYKVKGSVTREQKLTELSAEGIEPFQIHVDENGVHCDGCTDFWKSDTLILNIPPGRRKGDVLRRHPEEIKAIIEKAGRGTINWIIFAGSTSVYDNHSGKVAEGDATPETASSDSGRALILVEQMLREETGFETTVIRFGGLYGYDRHPGRFLAGRKNVSGGNRPVNLIHRDDCLEIISRVISGQVRGVTLNAVSDGHPSRYEYYRAAAKGLGLDPPEFDGEEEQPGFNKIVSNEHLKKTLGYSFIYPDPLAPSP